MITNKINLFLIKHWRWVVLPLFLLHLNGFMYFTIKGNPTWTYVLLQMVVWGLNVVPFGAINQWLLNKIKNGNLKFIWVFPSLLMSNILACFCVICFISLRITILDDQQSSIAYFVNMVGLMLEEVKDNLYDIILHMVLFAIPALLLLSYQIVQTINTNQETEKENLWFRLEHLKTQLNPQFLFKALSDIQDMAKISKDKASELILGLSDMMRYSLYETNQKSLNEELEFMNQYINLQQVRLEDTLDVEFEVFLQNTDNYTVPHLLFLPFLEQAFQVASNEVFISARNDTNMLFFQVKVDKKPNVQNVDLTKGLERIRLLYPENHQLELLNTPNAFWLELKLNLLPQ